MKPNVTWQLRSGENREKYNRISCSQNRHKKKKKMALSQKIH